MLDLRSTAGIAKIAIYFVLQSNLQRVMIFHITSLVRACFTFYRWSLAKVIFAVLELWICRLTLGCKDSAGCANSRHSSN